MVADKVLWQPECVQPPPPFRKNSPLAAQLKIAFRRFLFIPKLVLYISRPCSKFHSQPFRKKECLSIEFIASIPQELIISTHQHQSRPLLIKSWQNAAFYVQRICFLTEKQLHAIHCNLQCLSPWLSHNPVRITKSPITGKSFI